MGVIHRHSFFFFLLIKGILGKGGYLRGKKKFPDREGIKSFVSLQVKGFLRVLWFPQPIKGHIFQTE